MSEQNNAGTPPAEAPAEEKPKEPENFAEYLEQEFKVEEGDILEDSPGDEPAAPEAPPAQPAEQKPAPTVYRLPITVDGKEEIVEVPEEALRDPSSEAGRRFRSELQKARDYDRPGGALDKQAARKAEEYRNQWLLEQGFAVRGEDGRLQPTRAWAKHQQRVAAPAPQRAADPLEKLAADTEAAWEKARSQGATADDFRAATALESELRAQRALQADRQGRAAAEQQRARVAQQQTVQQIERRILDTEAAIVTEHASALRRPDGSGDIEAVTAVKAVFRSAIEESVKAGKPTDETFEIARKRAGEFATRFGPKPAAATELPRVERKPGGGNPPGATGTPKASAAPVLRGGPSRGAAEDTDDDPNDPFRPGAMTRWLRKQQAVRG